MPSNVRPQKDAASSSRSAHMRDNRSLPMDSTSSSATTFSSFRVDTSLRYADHRDECAVSARVALNDGVGEVAAATQLRYRQRDVVGRGRQAALAVAVTAVCSPLRLLRVLGVAEAVGPHRHDLVKHSLHSLGREVAQIRGIRTSRTAGLPSARTVLGYPVRCGHRLSFQSSIEQPTIVDDAPYCSKQA